MTHQQIIAYFKTVNQNLNVFGDNSFFRMDLSEITGGFRTGITFPCLVAESPEGDGSESNLHSSVMGKLFAFTVYHKPQRGNYDDQNEKLGECEAIVLKILARMRHDARIPDHLLYNRLEISSVNYIKVGPIFTENLYGYRCTGMIKAEVPLKVDPADWDDVEEVC